MTKDEMKKQLSKATETPNSYYTINGFSDVIQKIALGLLAIGVILGIVNFKTSAVIAISTIIEFCISAGLLYGVSKIICGISEIVLNTYTTKRLLELQIKIDNEIE